MGKGGEGKGKYQKEKGGKNGRRARGETTKWCVGGKRGWIQVSNSTRERAR